MKCKFYWSSCYYYIVIKNAELEGLSSALRCRQPQIWLALRRLCLFYKHSCSHHGSVCWAPSFPSCLTGSVVLLWGRGWLIISATNGFEIPVLTQDKTYVKQSKEPPAKFTLCFLIPLEPLRMPDFLCLFKATPTVPVCSIYKFYSGCELSYACLIW